MGSAASSGGETHRHRPFEIALAMEGRLPTLESTPTGIQNPDDVRRTVRVWASHCRWSFPRMVLQDSEPYRKLVLVALNRRLKKCGGPSGILSPQEWQVWEAVVISIRHPDVTPLKKLNKKTFVLELFHGPTFAFKDVALQLLGNLFEFFLSRRNKRRVKGEKLESLMVLGATSGDTGRLVLRT